MRAVSPTCSRWSRSSWSAAVVGDVGPPHLGGEVLPARARGILRAAGFLGGGAPARVQRSPGGERLPEAEHQHLRLVERVRPRQRDAPLLVLGFEVRQPRGGVAARLGGAGARLVLRQVGVPFQRDAKNGLDACAARQLGVVAGGGAGVPRGQECE